MSVRQGRPLPPPETLLGLLDVKAREAVVAAREDIAPIVDHETPHASGDTARALGPRVSRTATGAALSVGAPRNRRHGNVTVAQVVRWVTKGTGVYREGPGPKHKIRASNPLRRMTLPGGAKRYSVKGQRPNDFIDRIDVAATPYFDRRAEEGAQEAARAIERAIG